MPKNGERRGSTGMGPRIRLWRKTVPLKSFELAILIKISQGSLSDIENNKSDPSALTIQKILTLTDIDWVWLLTGETGDVKVGKIPDSSSSQKAPIMAINIPPNSELIIRQKG